MVVQCINNIKSFFISVINQLDEHNFVLQYVYFMPLYVSSTCAHHQEVKIALHSLWYHHTHRLITEINILRCTVSKTSKINSFVCPN